MSADPRDPLIREAIESFNVANVETLLRLMHPEVRSRVAEGLGNPGSYEGVEGFGAMMADWSEAWSEQQIKLREIEHVGDSVSLVHVHQSLVGAGSGIPVEAETTFLVAFESNQVTRFEIHPGRFSAFASLRGSPSRMRRAWL